MNNHTKKSSGPEKLKQLQNVCSNTVRGTSIKRTNSPENVDNVSKKIKLDTAGNVSAWRAGNDEIVQVGGKKDCTTMAFSVSEDSESFADKAKLITVNSKIPATNTDLVVIRNLGSKALDDLAPLSPQHNTEELSHEYVLYASDLTEYVNDGECSKNKSTAVSSSIEIPASSLEPVISSKMNINTISRNDAVGKTSFKDSAGSLSIQCAESSVANEIELVFLPSAQETKASLQTNSESPKLAATGARIIGSPTGNVTRHGTVSYTHITTASSLPSGLQSTAAILSRMNVPPLKNQQLVVTTKKLPSEVTQTTAKVSIGNTTISVPLLKPLNTPQLIHPSNLIGDALKSSQATAVQPHTSQTQFNLSKILNVKRGQKGTQPTIVSLSQLQIKPVSTAKLVQAKVLNKKLPQVAYTMSTNSQPNAGVVTITASKPNQNFTSTVFCSKKQELPVSIGTDELKASGNTTPLEVDASAELPPNESKSASNNFQKLLNEKHDLSQMGLVNSEKNASNENITSSAAIKNVLGSTNVNILPLLTPLPKNTDQQMLTNLYPTVSIIRQTTPQLITTSATGTCVSTSTNVSDTNIQAELHSNKSPISINSFCGKLNATPVISIPRNISLMLAKNNINQQGKTTFVTAKATSTAEQRIKKVNLSMTNGSNASPVTVSQSYGSIPQTSESTIKQAVISVSVQPPSSSISSEPSLFARKPVKLTPYNISALGYVEKRAKVPDSSDQYPRSVLPQNNVSNSQSLDVLPLKRSRIDNQRTPAESSIASVCDTTTDSDKTNSDSNVLRSVEEDNILSISKSEESNNALLKQLLQNSNTSNQTNVSISATGYSSSTSPLCSQVLSARKVINVRAPSLGLVSSLEAQLARPVIPPVPTTTSSQASHDAKPTIPKQQEIIETLQKKSDFETNIIKSDNKSKSVGQIISKETSFVSNPNKLHSSDDANYSQSYKTSLDIGVVSAACTDSNGISTHAQATVKLESVEESENISHRDTSELLEYNSYLYRGNTILTISTSTIGATSEVSSNASSKLKFQTCAGRPNPNMSTISEKNNGPDNQANPTLHGHASSLSTVSLSNNSVDKSSGLTKSPKVYNRKVLDAANTANLLKKQDSEEAFSHTNLKNNSIPEVETQGNYATNDIEIRKKRKREYQKHRRQLLNSKDLSTNVGNPTLTMANTKKRPRKFSQIEEDYDNFIENLITNLRQMKPLQVLEPLLNRNCVVCNAYGMNRSTYSFESNESGDQAMTFPLLGEYGCVQFSNALAMYDTVPFSSISKASLKQFSAIQNDFYDQEFSTSVRNNENDKSTRFYGFIRDRNIEALDVISTNRNNYYEMNCLMGNSNKNWITVPQILHPGLVLMNKSNSHYLGRMSPILPIVEPTSNGKKYVVLQNDAIIANMENVRQRITLDYKQRNTSEKQSSNQVVTLSMPLSSVDNVIGVLKDLANLLHITPPTIYKIIDAPTYNSPKQHPINQKKSNNIKKNLRQNALQKILCGREKYCYSCGQPIVALGIRAHKTPFCGSNTNSLFIAPMKLHFCSERCYEHVKELGKIRDVQKTSSAVIRSEFKPESENVDISQYSPSKSKDNDKAGNSIKYTKLKNGRYKYFSANCFHERQQLKHVDAKYIFKIISTSTQNGGEQDTSTDCILKSPIEDTRQCIFCSQRGDGLPDGASRLLNFEINKWVHLNCALWSNEVYETISGGLMNFQAALQIGLNQSCSSCQHLGATVRCFKNRCGLIFHLPCAIKEQCVFYKNKTIHCQQHATRLEKENELTSLIVQRRVFVERDENQQVASVMHHSELTNLLRIGTLIFLNVGQLLPHQLDSFHNFDHIYPIGYKVIRLYWSMRKPNKRCRYICSIAEVAGHPEFRIQVQEAHGSEIDLDLRDITPNAVWQQILTPIALMRKRNKLVQLFPRFISGEDLFGLTEPSVVRIMESLPGVDTLTDYRFKYGRNPLLELPLAINPSGAARTEPKQRLVFNWRKPHTQRTGSSSNQRMVNSTTTAIAGEIACPYSKQFVHSKSSQYKKMKQEWRNNVYLARSKIQGLGLYAARDIEKHTMIIEYIGEVIRTEVSEIREKQYEAKNRGIYMFRLDEERVVDATLSGGLARYVNHACNPNCVTEIVDVDRELRIIIFAKRRINRGEELSYDYKFDIEDDAHKISCMCGAPNCRKWMN